MPPGPAKESDYARRIGERIRARREELGLSQKALGERLVNVHGGPVDPKQISHWEGKGNVPRQSRWPEIAAALETTPEAIFGAMDLEETLAARVEAVEDQLGALISVLGVEDAVVTALRARAAAERRRRRTKEAERLMQVADEAPRLVRKAPRSSRPRRTGS